MSTIPVAKGITPNDPPRKPTDYSAMQAMKLTEIAESAIRQEKLLSDIRRTCRITATILFFILIFIPFIWWIMRTFA